MGCTPKKMQQVQIFLGAAALLGVVSVLVALGDFLVAMSVNSWVENEEVPAIKLELPAAALLSNGGGGLECMWWCK